MNDVCAAKPTAVSENLSGWTSRPQPAKRTRVAERRPLLAASHVQDDCAAVLADEVVVPDGEAAATVGDVLVQDVTCLARARPLGCERVDEIAATAHLQ